MLGYGELPVNIFTFFYIYLENNLYQRILSHSFLKGVEPNERGFETKSYNSFTSDETEMLLMPTLDMAQNHLSCSENSFFGSDLDEEEKF